MKYAKPPKMPKTKDVKKPMDKAVKATNTSKSGMTQSKKRNRGKC